MIKKIDKWLKDNYKENYYWTTCLISIILMFIHMYTNSGIVYFIFLVFVSISFILLRYDRLVKK